MMNSIMPKQYNPVNFWSYLDAAHIYLYAINKN